MILGKFIFWVSLLAVFYAYFGYPLILWLLTLVKTPKHQQPKGLNHQYTPTVSLIIAAYNEEKRIAQKIENSLNQTYPKNKLEIIVASDCSSDRTDEIVTSHGTKGVRLVRAPERKGKENAQKYAIEQSKGEILIFSDVGTILQPEGIANMVRNFIDPTIGCVSSEDRIIDRDEREK